jgi:hypothetical protein
MKTESDTTTSDFDIVREAFVQALSFVQGSAFKSLEKTLDEASAALWRIEMRSPGRPIPAPLRHAYELHKKYPWFCGHCGYAEHDPLQHLPRTT